MTRAAPAPQSDDRPARLRILAAARDAILASGFLETSMDRIAQRAGASKQTLYALFNSREQLFREMLRVTMEESSEEAPDTSALDLADAARAYAQWVERSAVHPANLELYRANVAAAAVFPELAADLHRLRRRATPFSAFVAEQQRVGRLPDGDADQLAHWLGVLAIGGVRLLLGPPPTPAERHARLDAIVATFAHGWRMPAAGLDATPAHTSIAAPPPPAAPLEQRGRISAAKWTALLRLAAARFCDAGFRAASVEQIGAQTGIAKMSIYRRFGNKDGLFAAALDQAADDLLAARPAMPAGDDIAATLGAIARAHDRFAQRPDHIRLIRLLVTEAPSHAETVQRVWRRLVTPAQADLAARLDVWRAAGAIHLRDSAIAAEHFLLLAARGNRRLTDTIAWDEGEAADHARSLVALFDR